MARQLFLADLLVVRDLVAVHAAVRLGDVVRNTRAQLREALLKRLPCNLRYEVEPVRMQYAIQIGSPFA